MGVLTPPRPQLVDTAIKLRRQWCSTEMIDDDFRALAHALRVARKITQHLPDAAPDLIAAALLHDVACFAPDGADLDAVLTEQLSPAVARILRSMLHEGYTLVLALDAVEPLEFDISDPDALVVSAADQIVTIGEILRQARRAGDAKAFWGTRRQFIRRVPFDRTFAVAAEPHLPAALARELVTVVGHAYEATAAYRWPLPHPRRSRETS